MQLLLRSKLLTIFLGCTLSTQAQALDSIDVSPDRVQELEQVVVTGTMKESGKLDSPVPVEVYNSAYFKTNPSASLFDAIQHINGVRPQVNCNICNTGDIHINGLEGPYTMILIDGMPIVSGLGTVYGLSGIPQAMIDRIEVVKGPAATLYGSEAVGGLINVITKKVNKAPRLSAEIFGTSWLEFNADAGMAYSLGKNIKALSGINYFNYSNPIDQNNDGFTDLTLQHRASIFNKWDIRRKENRLFSIGMRYVYEDRWGGQTWWNKSHRGKDDVYGESIYTNRWEVLAQYQLPTREHLLLQVSGNGHNQNSAYGTTLYDARQDIGFAQLLWYKSRGMHDLLAGAAYRINYYDDNTAATEKLMPQGHTVNNPQIVHLPGLFVQDEISLHEYHTLLLGLRYDYNSRHGNIFTPRLNYKFNTDNNMEVLRLSVGSGYRVAHVYTEDHAALSGARDLVFAEELRPETSWNANLNFVKKIYTDWGDYLNIDFTTFYTYFYNKILPDYDSNPTQIIYGNLDGNAVSKGVSLNLQYVSNFGINANLGATWMDVYSHEHGEKTRQYFAERFSGVWNVSYKIPSTKWSFDYTGNVYSPMLLPLVSALDPRPAESPWYSIQNIQATYVLDRNIEVFGGVKNLLNWTPSKRTPFLIARAHDPFNKDVLFDSEGIPLVTAENPYGLSFDPAYMYASNQGIRFFVGIRYQL